ncbi:MAG: hypothetical protein EPO10_20130 [Reyranella sp.]|uniref:hypothetical protein n=1 Tax=Reyranella sp. TaxID=1929291 RepID=UPI001211FFBE|nr:hypothetical protein [Reyranella sp.]TAJ94762.1 MAG: hypothetical protein EPO41_11870 [Reyranella sp.]TBR27046.1 MAG: hypothetical protein EPO10_20130 [Reyranella sp.]
MLTFIRAAHTIVWLFFVACIAAIWVFAARGDYLGAAVSIGLVFVECVVLAVNGWKCPLTAVAARHTDDRRDNFDIYLPQWLARHNKSVFGTLYLAGIAFTLARWTRLLP